MMVVILLLFVLANGFHANDKKPVAVLASVGDSQSATQVFQSNYYQVVSQYTGADGFSKSQLDKVSNKSACYNSAYLVSSQFHGTSGGKWQFVEINPVPSYQYGPPCVHYNVPLTIKHVSGDWWLDTCGESIFCPDGASKAVQVADTNNRLYLGVAYNTGHWQIEGGTPNTCVNTGDQVHIRNLYTLLQTAQYLDVCNWGPLGVRLDYGVQTYPSNNRGNLGTGTWSIVLA